MGIVHINFVLQIDEIGNFTPEKAEIQYQSCIKKIISFLYSHPKCDFTISMYGQTLSWLEKKHSEVIDILSELSQRKQIEILGGGYNNPLFPLLLPIDRVGQIELLTTALRKSIGKKPRGVIFAKDAWEPSLISCFKISGFEYALLDSTVVLKKRPGQNSAYCPYIVEDGGKTLIVLPINNNLLPNSDVSSKVFISKVISLESQKIDQSVCCVFTPEQLASLIDVNWFDSLLEKVDSGSPIALSTPTKYLKSANYFSKTFIPAGSTTAECSVKDLFPVYPEILSLYSRMIHTSIIVNQYRKDKIRKKSAREDLWVAQNYKPYVDTLENTIESHISRQTAYHNILLAEKQVKDDVSPVADIFSTFDFDMDGYREYVCHVKNYSAFVSLLGGSLFELDIYHCCQNYSSTIKTNGNKISRKFFQDYFMSEDTFSNNYQNGNIIDNLGLSNIRFTEVVFSKTRKEVQLMTNVFFGKNKQQILLKKKYTFSDNGIQVQYIIKNESNSVLKCLFLSESNIAIPSIYYTNRKVEVLVSEVNNEVCCEQLFVRQNDVSLVQVSDINTKTTFTFESNENSSICIQPLMIENVAISTCCGFYWNLNMQPGAEIEKTLLLNIKSSKKKALSKN